MTFESTLCYRLSVILHLYLTIHRVPELTYLSHQILVCCLNTMSAIFHPEIFYWTVFKMKRSTQPFYIYRFMAHRHHDFTGKSSYFMLFIYAFHLCSSVTLTKKEKRTMIEILFVCMNKVSFTYCTKKSMIINLYMFKK